MNISVLYMYSIDCNVFMWLDWLYFLNSILEITLYSSYNGTLSCSCIGVRSRVYIAKAVYTRKQSAVCIRLKNLKFNHFWCSVCFFSVMNQVQVTKFNEYLHLKHHQVFILIYIKFCLDINLLYKKKIEFNWIFLQY